MFIIFHYPKANLYLDAKAYITDGPMKKKCYF